MSLAPSYDHASSLGRELTDRERERRLTTADSRGDVAAYCARARSAVFPEGATKKALACVQVFENACDRDPSAAKYWRERLVDMASASLQEVAERVPDSLMSPLAKEFASTVLINQLALLKRT